VIFLLLVMLFALFSIMIFRVVILGVMYQNTHKSNLEKYAKLIGAGTAAGLNFLVISIFEILYPR